MNIEQIKVWLESVVRPNIVKECGKEEHLALLAVARDWDDEAGSALGIYCFAVLSALAGYDDFEPLPERMEDMTEPQLGEHLSRQLRFIKGSQTPDTIGSMLLVFMQNGITQYGATVDPSIAPTALRETADRIERRETVRRGGSV